MIIIQCKMCSKPFQSMGGKYCGNCLQEIEEKFSVIKDYLYDNPGKKSAAELAEATEVEKEIIDYLIKEGRIVLDSGSGGPRCMSCHKPLATGDLCESCRAELSSRLSSTLPKAPEKKTTDESRSPRGGRMHVGRD